MCRAEFHGVRRVPSLKDDPDAWFRCVDVEGNGQLTRTQVQEVLVTQFPLDVTKFEAAMETLWPRWDHDLSGYVTREEFLSPESGLLNDVRTQLLKMPQAQQQPVPEIATERLKWFDHFDPAGAGALSQAARRPRPRLLDRAPSRPHPSYAPVPCAAGGRRPRSDQDVRSWVRLGASAADAGARRRRLGGAPRPRAPRAAPRRDALLPPQIFDSDGSGYVSREEFLKPGVRSHAALRALCCTADHVRGRAPQDGLADAIIASRATM